MRAFAALLILLSAGALTPTGALATVQLVAPAETPALLAARRLYAKALKEPQGEQGTAAINARWALATELTNADRHAEAEVELKGLEASLLARPGVDDRNLIAIQARIANAQVGQEHWAEAAETALPAYQRALALYGPDHATTQDLRMAMAASLTRLERLVESEPYARAGFDYLRRNGGDQEAADLATVLALIYEKLNRPDDARAVLRLVETDDPIRRLINEAERAESREDRVRAWRRVLDALPEGDARRIDVDTKLTFALGMSASRENPEPAREAVQRARALLAHAEANGLADLKAEANQLLSMGLAVLGDEDADAGHQALAMALDRLETARRELGEDDQETADRRVYYAMVAANQGRVDIALPELDRLDIWIAAYPGAFEAQTVAFVAMTRAFILGGRGDVAGAYRATARTTDTMQGIALEQIDQSRRAYLDHWGRLFQVQVRWAWRYADVLSGGSGAPAGTPTRPAD